MAKAANIKTENTICNSVDSINTYGKTAPSSDGNKVSEAVEKNAAETISEAAEKTFHEAIAKTAEKTVPTATNAYPGEKLVRIRIPHTEEDGDVFVSVNDRNWYIKRGSEVEIPECAAEVLIRREERIADAIDYENRLAANRRH